MAVYSQHEAADEPLPTASLGNAHDGAVRDFLDYEAAERRVDDSGSNAYSPSTMLCSHASHCVSRLGKSMGCIAAPRTASTTGSDES